MATFTKQQLFQVRNEIHIDDLISDKLNLERQFNGMWRFRCPLCQQFNTATQKKTNLGRCFSCQQNFNTIDLVIYSKKINFVPAVQWLLSLLDNKPSSGQSNQRIKIENRILSDKKIRKVNRTKGRQEIEKIKQMIQ
ncbi:MAG: hypothetical protein KZQ74_13940 [gamma proteobacterium symbiont of Bathyaustriella thionipta]|nr:hypothetical protein [gamma proteobacterium symbiont of Bathyaustriella thionipta]MCU7951317.1 hypothetical protein [gamma proteobacterium symbiont of Bathyaustriella thionipta]MCU7968271.1 hypothetical protein [gamma proteobacterium symbiont of Bathyaustriella thionipta]